MKPGWLWDTKLTIEEIQEILKDSRGERFVNTAALLLSRNNAPKEVFDEYLDKKVFVQNWTRVKRQMRKDSWSEPRIVFWQAVYEKIVDEFKAQGLSLRLSAEKESLGWFSEQIAGKIKTAREESGLTQSELAKRMGISQQIISRVESGRSDMRVSTLEKIFRFLGDQVVVDTRNAWSPEKINDGKKKGTPDKEVKCLSCAKIIFHIVPLNEKGDSWGIDVNDRGQYERSHKNDGDKEFYLCPECHKKNWISSVAAPGKGLRSWISHVTE